MVTQLGKTLRGEKGILRKSIDTHRNGWERVPRSHQHWYSQEVLCLRPPEEKLVRIENSKGRFWQEKKRKKEKRFKVKTRKGSLNHKKWKKKKKENERSSWKPERAAWLQKRIPRLKTWKGDLGKRKLIKGSLWESRVWHMLGKDWRRQLKAFFGIGPIAYWHGIFRMFIVRSSFSPSCTHTYFESINEKSFGPSNPLPSFATSIPLQMCCAFYFVAWLD